MDINPGQHNTLPEGQFFHDQIIGLQVITTDGQVLGKVTDIITGQSNDNFVVQDEAGEVLIPAIEDVIMSIDPSGGFITIDAIEGLLDLNKKKPSK